MAEHVNVSIGDGLPAVLYPGDEGTEHLPPFEVAVVVESVASTSVMLFTLGTFADYVETLAEHHHAHLQGTRL